ncbi:inorganic diphosphatase [Membranihabitans maritimus]|uniref:inorganic diphosphatase n=1 Tax=Membranihabitans maritimus TaxID=2904244 RepID=UPI001F1DF446|nr:inorganic diphosphatase [Membranihabitans maritimus]
MFNPWHEVNIGDKIPEMVNGIIEIPRNSRAKYELDKDSGLLRLDRVLYSSVNYPANYGFIPQTYCEDRDPLDILILSQMDIVPMCIVESNVIGVMRMLDGNEKDDKIIAVASNDKSVSHYNDVSELPDHFFLELQSFFEDYKKLENKTVTVEDFQNKDVALEVINDAINLYQKHYGGKL